MHGQHNIKNNQNWSTGSAHTSLYIAWEVPWWLSWHVLCEVCIETKDTVEHCLCSLQGASWGWRNISLGIWYKLPQPDDSTLMYEINTWFAIEIEKWPIKANSHTPCHSHAGPMPFRYGFRLCLFHLIYTVLPCLIHTCHAMTMPFWKQLFKATQYSAAWAWHGMYELALAGQRWHVGDLPSFSFFQLPHGVPRRLLLEAYQSVKL
jgi:hypothetical protein